MAYVALFSGVFSEIDGILFLTVTTAIVEVFALSSLSVTTALIEQIPATTLCQTRTAVSVDWVCADESVPRSESLE